MGSRGEVGCGSLRDAASRIRDAHPSHLQGSFSGSYKATASIRDIHSWRLGVRQDDARGNFLFPNCSTPHIGVSRVHTPVVEGVLVPISNRLFTNPGDRTEFTDFKKHLASP